MLSSMVASCGVAGLGNADPREPPIAPQVRPWRFLPSQPPRSGFVQWHHGPSAVAPWFHRGGEKVPPPLTRSPAQRGTSPHTMDPQAHRGGRATALVKGLQPTGEPFPTRLSHKGTRQGPWTDPLAP